MTDFFIAVAYSTEESVDWLYLTYDFNVLLYLWFYCVFGTGSDLVYSIWFDVIFNDFILFNVSFIFVLDINKCFFMAVSDCYSVIGKCY